MSTDQRLRIHPYEVEDIQRRLAELQDKVARLAAAMVRSDQQHTDELTLAITIGLVRVRDDLAASIMPPEDGG